MPLLLVYSVNTQALTATTAQVINGSEPYITFDNGVTKVTQAEGLLGITLSDGTNITPATNTSATDPLMLPGDGETFADVQMLVPTTANTIELKELIGAPNNYWGDDDGDGQGADGITATGSLSLSITDRFNQAISRSDNLEICKGPYKVTLSASKGSLTTKFGVSNSRIFTDSSTTYYIDPQSPPVICYARPSLTFGIGRFAGPIDVWNPTTGFLVQSSYDRNFPTTGANNLYFDLLVGGNVPLRWPSVTKGGITATMTLHPDRDSHVNPDGDSSVRVTFTGPVATDAQRTSNAPGLISKPTLPQTFELVGYDSNNNAVIKYGFVLKQWFVNRGNIDGTFDTTTSWCSSTTYRMPQGKDLTNARDPSRGFVGATTPASPGNHYQRNVGAGFFTEWGFVYHYTGSGFVEDNYGGYWTSDIIGDSSPFWVFSYFGDAGRWDKFFIRYGVCTYP